MKNLRHVFFVSVVSILFPVLMFVCSGCLFPSQPVLDTTGDLIVRDSIVGTGAAIPTADTCSQIAISFIGTLKDGTVFASSPNVMRNTTATFAVGPVALGYTHPNSMIYGLDSALRGMRVGGWRIITVPPRFGYGTQSQNNIPSNSTLSYKIQLVSVQVLRREDITVGTGDTAKATNTAFVTYVGRLTNGAIFDNSQPGQFFSFRVGSRQVISGWDLGVLGMRVGGRRILTIPPIYGYGATPQGLIPANSTLVFDITLNQVTQ